MLAAFCASGLPLSGAEYFVDAGSGNDASVGTSWAAAKQTIQSAVDLAVDGDTVWVTNGVYDAGSRVAAGEALASRLCITNAVVVRSVNGAGATTIAGAPGSNGGLDADAVRGVYLNGGASLFGFLVTNGYTSDDAADGCGAGVWIGKDCTVSNCVIRGNVADWDGGGAFLDRHATLVQCTLSGNQAHAGGGAYLDSYSGEITDCVVSNNSAISYGAQGGGLFIHGYSEALRCTVVDNFSNEDGGGLYFWDDGTATDCLIERNRADDGAGVYLHGGYWAGRLLDCTIRQNAATGYGGGLFVQTGTEVTACMITSNSAGYYGGGTYFDQGGTLDGCVLAGNTAAHQGGGAYLKEDGTLRSCTISQNSASGYGGGVRTLDGGTIQSSIVWNNSSESLGQDIASYGTAPAIIYSCASDGLVHGTDNCITNNPMFVDEAVLDFQLHRGSPCIDAGDNDAWWTSYDIAGNLRKVGDALDMGAYESDFQPLDTDGDGIPDWWEEQYYAGATNAPAQQTASNGVNTVLEAYISGLDPTNSMSFFEVAIESSSNTVVQWDFVSNRVFSIYWSSNLFSAFTLLESNVQWAADGFIDQAHGAGSQGFYKMDVQLGN